MGKEADCLPLLCMLANYNATLARLSAKMVLKAAKDYKPDESKLRAHYRQTAVQFLSQAERIDPKHVMVLETKGIHSADVHLEKCLLKTEPYQQLFCNSPTFSSMMRCASWSTST